MEGAWQLSVSSRRFAQYVSVDVPGYVPDDSWFHLPRAEALTLLRPCRGAGGTADDVRAPNSAVPGADPVTTSFAP